MLADFLEPHAEFQGLPSHTGAGTLSQAPRWAANPQSAMVTLSGGKSRPAPGAFLVQWSTGGIAHTNTGSKSLYKTRFLPQYPRLKVTKKVRVKSPSTRDLPGLPSALSGCWPSSQALLRSLLLHLSLLRRPRSGAGEQCEDKRKSQHIFPHFYPKCLLTGAADFPGCNRSGRRWSWTEIRLKSERTALFTESLTYHRSTSTPGQLEFSVASSQHGLQKKRSCFSAIFLRRNQGEVGGGAMFWPQGCGTF